MKLNYYKELDGVRGMAALMVMFFHFFQGLQTHSSLLLSLQKVSVFGQTGVSLFFVLSGFLITRILLSTKGDENYFQNFYIRRALRIFPLYYLFLVIYYFIIPALNKEPIPAFGQQIYYWVYLQNFAITFNWESAGPFHFWSLAVEEHFYMFWPLMIYFFDKKKIVYSIIFILILSFIVRIVLVTNGFEAFYFTFSRIDEIALGALLAIRESNKKLNNSASSKYLYALLIMIVPVLVLWTFFTGSGNPVVQVIKFFLISFIYYNLIGYIVTVKEQHFIKRIFKSKPMLYTGKISYGLYVYHGVGYAMFSYFFTDASFIIKFISCFICAYILASLSYYLYEANFLKLKKYFNYGNTKKMYKPAEVLQPVEIDR